MGDSLFINRYLKQHYLITDSTKSKAVWFNILMGYDGKDFWIAADTDYDSLFNDEKPCRVTTPLNYSQATTGQKFEGEILKFNLNGFPLSESKWHPEFSIFVQPTFCFLSDSRDIDSLVINAVLISGQKDVGKLTIQGEEMSFVILLHSLMSDLSLFEYYNPRHQQMSMVNLLKEENGQTDRLIAYENAYTFLVRQKPMAIEGRGISLFPIMIDKTNRSFTIDILPMLHTSIEDKISKCKLSHAINLISKSTFEFPQRDSIIFYFTGSWCVPCREMTPKVEAFFNKLPPGWVGYVVANEKGIEDADIYLSGYKFKNMLYEQLSDRSDCSLKSIFAIGLYPSFVYLSPTGKLMWQGSAIKE